MPTQALFERIAAASPHAWLRSRLLSPASAADARLDGPWDDVLREHLGAER